jgi:hypothetical protein
MSPQTDSMPLNRQLVGTKGLCLLRQMACHGINRQSVGTKGLCLLRQMACPGIDSQGDQRFMSPRTDGMPRNKQSGGPKVYISSDRWHALE